MTKSEYLSNIKTHLKRLPKQDFDQAMNYFNEYFEEAGPGQEANAIEDLGDPKTAADQILRNLAIYNAKEPEKKSVKRSLDSVWIGILAIFAAPIALPLVLALVIVILALLFSVLVVIGSFLFSGALIGIVSIIPLIAGLVLLASYPASGVVTIGAGLLMLGGGLLVAVVCFTLGRLFLRGITKMIGHCVKGGKRHEKN